MGRRHIVVGGGVAGVTCAEELGRMSKDDEVFLVSSDALLKKSKVVQVLSENVEEVDVAMECGESAFSHLKNVKSIHGIVSGVEVERKVLTLASGESMSYDTLCICTGASPKRVLDSDLVTVLRDTDSIASMNEQLEHCTSLMVVGNGGIALDIIAAIRGIETYWIVRHEQIGDAFFDGEVGAFLLEELQYLRSSSTRAGDQSSSRKDGTYLKVGARSSAGPKWTQDILTNQPQANEAKRLHIETNCEVLKLSRTVGDDKIKVALSNGKEYSVDMVVSAIGVDPAPAVAWVPPSVHRSPHDGGILVDTSMKTSVPDVYAAGDACSLVDDSKTPWFQMRLWSQARSMGLRAAHCMLGVEDQMASDLPFEMFVHVTRFLGKRVIFLGCYNGQKLEQDDGTDDSIRLYSRVAGTHPDRNFVRVVIQDGRVRGAVCIGETDLEETLENLILDGIDVSAFGADILDPDVGIDDVFD